MIRLLVIADDLTGAVDTGVQFARKGIPTLVTPDPDPDFDRLAREFLVLVADTESRHLPPGEAAEKVSRLVGAAREAGVARFYKKTDSTLRGNVGAELEAAFRASGSRVLAFVPAFPGAGRYTRQGCHYLDTTPLHLTQFGSDPIDPVPSSSILEILALQSGARVRSVGAGDLDSLEAGLSAGCEILVFDAESDSDLRAAGAALESRDLLGMTAGSAGFAAVLPELLKLPGSRSGLSRPEEPALILNGSVNRTSLEQVRRAEETGIGTWTLAPEMILASGPENRDRLRTLASELAGEAARGCSVILRSLEARENLDDFLAEYCQNQDIKDICRLVSRNLGIIASRILEAAPFRALAVFGGDTLIGVLEALRATGIRPLDELSPGLVVSRMAGTAHDLPLISKAGGFGDENVILRIISYLRGEVK